MGAGLLGIIQSDSSPSPHTPWKGPFWEEGWATAGDKCRDSLLCTQHILGSCEGSKAGPVQRRKDSVSQEGEGQLASLVLPSSPFSLSPH